MFPRITLISVNFSDYPSPPLGLISIATYLIKKKLANRNSIQILDLNVEKNHIPKIKKFKPDIIGISSMTQFYPRAIKVAKKIKTSYRRLPIVIGGVHISTAPQSFSNIFYLGVIGEGEKTFYELVSYFQSQGSLKKNKLKDIPGLIFKEKARLVQTQPRKIIMPLDALPIPDWKLISSYLSHYLKSRRPLGSEKKYRAGYMITSRGCPYQCVFCSTSAFWKKLRFHSSKYIAEEIEYLAKQFNINYIFIQDDIFNFSKKRIKEIITELKKRKLLGKVEFGASARVDYIDKEFCLLFKTMGGTNLFIGFESGSEKILKFLKNNTVTPSDNKKAALLLNKHQIKIQGSIIFGSPEESLTDMEKTLQFMKWFSNLKYATRLDANILTPFPGTKVWEIALKKGLVSNKTSSWEKLDITTAKPFFATKVDNTSFAKIYERARKISHEITLSNFIRLKTEKRNHPQI